MVTVGLKSLKKTFHPPELWWILINHPGNVEAVVKLQTTKTALISDYFYDIYKFLCSPTWTDAFRVPNNGERMSEGMS